MSLLVIRGKHFRVNQGEKKKRKGKPLDKPINFKVVGSF